MQNDFVQCVTRESVMTIEVKNKLEALDQLIDRAAELTGLNRDLIFRLTWKREQMMTTGVGFGLAMPHIRINDIAHPVVIVGVCKTPIEEYDRMDDQPIRVIVFTIAPDEDQNAYLTLLSSISRKLRNTALVDEIAGLADTPEKILDVLTRKD